MGFLDKLVGGNINKRPNGPQSPSSQYQNASNPYPPASSLAQSGSDTKFASNNPYGGNNPYDNGQQTSSFAAEKGGDERPVPEGWVKQWNEQYKQHFYVDTRTNPPRSIWVHPYDDPEFQRSNSGYDRPQGAPVANQNPGGGRMFGMGGHQQGPPQGYGGGYNGPPQGYSGYGPPQQMQNYGQPQYAYQQQSIPAQGGGRKKMGGGGMMAPLAMGAGAGLLGGALLGSALSDNDYEQGYENGYDNGFDNGDDYGGGDFGGGDFGDF